MLAVLAVALALAGGAKTPHDAVLRFIENHSPADACAQLAPAYKKAIEASYGPCLAGMRVQPKATRIVVSHEQIHGTKATVVASYHANGSNFRERYALARTKGIWLITGSRQI